MDQIKADFGTKLKDRLDDMQAETKMQAEMHMSDLKKLMDEVKMKFDETDSKCMQIFDGARTKFQEMEAKINTDNGHQHKGSKTNGFLPDKMFPKFSC